MARQHPRTMIATLLIFLLLFCPAYAHCKNDLKSLRLISANTGWVASEQQLWMTTDDGTTWKSISPQATREGAIVSVFFLDETRGWVLLMGNPTQEGEPQFRVAATTDGGANWSINDVTLPPHQNPVGDAGCIFFVNPQYGWMNLEVNSSANFRLGYLLRTQDGGKSWTPTPNSPGVYGDVRFFNPQDGWLAGGPGNTELYVTHDAAKTWTRVSPQPPTEAPALTAPKYELPLFVAGNQGFLNVTYESPSSDTSTLVTFTTNDMGRSWVPVEVVHQAGQPQIRAHAEIVDSELILATAYHLNGNIKVSRTKFGGQISSAYFAPQHGALAHNNLAVRKLSFATQKDGWMLTTDGLLKTVDGGSNWTNITPRSELGPAVQPQTTSKPPVEFPPHAKGRFPRRHGARSGGLVKPRTNEGVMLYSPSTGIPVRTGFDTCEAPSMGFMQTWWSDSPYFDVGIYIGGQSRTCSQPNLSAPWVASAISEGWALMPLWAGPQPPCACHGDGTYPTCARFPHVIEQDSDGFAEAEATAEAATALGLAGTVVYYDMENYDPAITDCADTVNVFLSDWITGMRSSGFLVGLYGNPSPAASWWHAGLTPDSVWITEKDRRATIWGIGHGMTDSMWSNNQRTHQYQLATWESWGGTALEQVDKDIVTSDVVAGNGGKPVSFSPAADPYGDSSVSNDINASGYIVGYYGNVGQSGNSGYLKEGGAVIILNYPGTNQTYPFGVNDRFLAGLDRPLVVGSQPADGSWHGFLYDDADGTYANIPGLTEAYGINDDRQIVGYVGDTGALLQNGELMTFAYPDAISTTANAINGAGQIVGSYYDSEWNEHGFLYWNPYPGGSTQTPIFSTIDFPNASQTMPVDINNNGQVVGWYEWPVDWSWHGFFYDPKLGYRTLDYPAALNPGGYTTANGINDASEVVGYYIACDGDYNCGYSQAFRASPPYYQ